MSPLIALSATNPCHVYDMAVALHAKQALKRYYSGYPAWRLQPPAGFPMTARSMRTVLTYGLLRLPHYLRPDSPTLCRWQDEGFDRAVADALGEGNGDTLHGLPGQTQRTFQAAQKRGWRTVLNHASGPVRQQLALIAPEYQRAGLELPKFHGFDRHYFAREDAEYAAADFHCAASTIVAGQLQSAGVPRDKIWIVPYAANPAVFHRPPDGHMREPRRVVYAGQLTQRKGLRILFTAMRQLRASWPLELHLYGPAMPDIAPDLAAVQNEPWIKLHSAVSQVRLAAAFQDATVLVLPSWEEAFGLVVPQALNCGLPCVVSDRVGASDLIRRHGNGSVFPAGNAEALATEIDWWLRHPATFSNPLLSWDCPAEMLLVATRQACA